MMAFLLIIISLLLFLFVFVDVWYFVRLLVLVGVCCLRQKLRLTGKRVTTTMEALLCPSQVQGLVLPSDMDLQLHMNNSKYLREMDFGRILFFMSSRFYEKLKTLGGNLVVGASTIRYRKSLQLWQRFVLKTRILCWLGDALYVEQRFVRRKDGFVCAVALLKMSTMGVPVDRVLERLCVDSCQSPPFPPEVESWAQAIDRSKENLKKERGK